MFLTIFYARPLAFELNLSHNALKLNKTSVLLKYIQVSGLNATSDELYCCALRNSKKLGLLFSYYVACVCSRYNACSDWLIVTEL